MTTESKARAKLILKERKQALLSMDEKEIRAYAKKWGANLPDDAETFWAAVHKARTAAEDLPMAERAASKRWLHVKGFNSFDEGDVLPPTKGKAAKRYWALVEEWGVQ